jgi:hypothetical protein
MLVRRLLLRLHIACWVAIGKKYNRSKFEDVLMTLFRSSISFSIPLNALKTEHTYQRGHSLAPPT